MYGASQYGAGAYGAGAYGAGAYGAYGAAPMTVHQAPPVAHSGYASQPHMAYGGASYTSTAPPMVSRAAPQRADISLFPSNAAVYERAISREELYETGNLLETPPVAAPHYATPLPLGVETRSNIGEHYGATTAYGMHAPGMPLYGMPAMQHAYAAPAMQAYGMPAQAQYGMPAQALGAYSMPGLGLYGNPGATLGPMPGAPGGLGAYAMPAPSLGPMGNAAAPFSDYSNIHMPPINANAPTPAMGYAAPQQQMGGSRSTPSLGAPMGPPGPGGFSFF